MAQEKVDLHSPETIQEVWEKGTVVPGYNKDLYRKDAVGAWICRDDYADRGKDFGWEMDHVYPKKKGGEDYMENLRPMNWRNNMSKDNDYPRYRVAVKAEGYRNVKDEQYYTVSKKLQNILKELYDYD